MRFENISVWMKSVREQKIHGQVDNVPINNIYVGIELYTGAQLIIMPLNFYKKLKMPLGKHK